jgi:cbb3-type cytochrome oxidase cytochrome c subunit
VRHALAPKAAEVVVVGLMVVVVVGLMVEVVDLMVEVVDLVVEVVGADTKIPVSYELRP